MTSDEARGRVVDYAYGEMSPDEAARFEALLASDEALRAEVEAVRAVREAASGLAAVPLPVDVRVRLLREAERYARKRVGTAPVFWSFLERFLLSPAFTGAMVVVVALGVGVHLLLEMGTEDRLTRIERAERAAVSRSEPAREPAGPTEDKVAPPSLAGIETTEPHGAEERPETGAAGRPGRRTARKKVTAATEPRAGPTETAVAVDRAGVGEGGAHVAGEAETEVEPGGGLATTPAGRLPERSEAKAAGARTREGVGPRGMLSPAAPPKAAAEAPMAAAEGRPQAGAGDRDQALDEALADLARARLLRARGALEAALTAYRKALGAGTLTGSDLADALAEAAEVAIALERPDTARAFLDRLKTLPGGPARAAPIERELGQTKSR